MTMHLPSFEKAKVLVVGDLMLDRYWHGATSRISPEAPVPVVHVNQNEERAGGACNVALNIATLGASCTVMGLCGDDEAAATLESLLKSRRSSSVYSYAGKFNRDQVTRYESFATIDAS